MTLVLITLIMLNIEYQRVQLLSTSNGTITYPPRKQLTTANNLVLIQGTIEHVDKYENATALINNAVSKKVSIQSFFH